MKAGNETKQAERAELSSKRVAQVTNKVQVAKRAKKWHKKLVKHCEMPVQHEKSDENHEMLEQREPREPKKPVPEDLKQRMTEPRGTAPKEQQLELPMSRKHQPKDMHMLSVTAQKQSNAKELIEQASRKPQQTKWNAELTNAIGKIEIIMQELQEKGQIMCKFPKEMDKMKMYPT
eukprot:13839301-Ditylum_brightwellii.AAC.1